MGSSTDYGGPWSTDRRRGSFTKATWNAGRIGVRRLFKAQGPKDAFLGNALAHELDQMKGMAMKVGQILSYFDGILPDETHGALRMLQQGHDPMPFAQIESILEEAFSRPVAELFDSLEQTPVSAASIGQVHRARHNGHPVAVKVQYPGVAGTIDTDFRRLRRIARFASLATAVDGDAITEELRDRFREECDYTKEADNQRAFRGAFEADPEISIPDVVRERTSANVITMDWHSGEDLYTFLETSTQKRRDEVGLVLARFAFTSLFSLGKINADPHPGNYLFTHDGPITFLDFGCVRRFDPGFLEAHRTLVKTVIADERDGFQAALDETGMVARSRGFDYDLHWELLRHEYAPYCTPRFQFTNDYIRRGMDYSSPSNPNLRRLAIPPQWIWLERQQWGLHAVLARLQAQGPFARVMQEALERPCED